MGIASILAVATLGLWATGRLGLYINPSSNWFAVPMAVLVLVGAVLSFTLPAGAEADHGHDHGHGAHPVVERGRAQRDRDEAASAGVSGVSSRSARSTAGGSARATAGARRIAGAAIAGTAGAAASVVALAILLVPPASLSAEIAQSRDTGTPPLFAGADTVALATRGDTAQFGVGEWASVFATATNPESFEGDPVTLTGFVSRARSDDFRLTRMVITHCVIDAQPASVPVRAASLAKLGTGAWVRVTGTVRSTASGALEIDATDVRRIAEPKDPYEY